MIRGFCVGLLYDSLAVGKVGSSLPTSTCGNGVSGVLMTPGSTASSAPFLEDLGDDLVGCSEAGRFFFNLEELFVGSLTEPRLDFGGGLGFVVFSCCFFS